MTQDTRKLAAKVLKPCPFCGGKAVINDLGKNRYHIHCGSCLAQVGQPWSDNESLELLEHVWNHRAALDAAPERDVAERVREACTKICEDEWIHANSLCRSQTGKDLAAAINALDLSQFTERAGGENKQNVNLSPSQEGDAAEFAPSALTAFELGIHAAGLAPSALPAGMVTVPRSDINNIIKFCDGVAYHHPSTQAGDRALLANWVLVAKKLCAILAAAPQPSGAPKEKP